MIEIDGSQGEGGGQILRSALSCAALLGKPMRITNIRLKREKPGLKRQHLTGARAVAEICNGTLAGAELNSTELTLEPGKIRGGEFHFSIGTAGSVALVAQTVLPLLLMADTPSTVIIEGGTHVEAAPTFEFFEEVFLAQLRAMGFKARATLEQHGFFPDGGGRIRLDVEPRDVSTITPYTMLNAGGLKSVEIVARVSGIDTKIAYDEAKIIERDLESLNPFVTTKRVEAACPGNVAYVKMEFENITEIFSAIGNAGRSRHSVAKLIVQHVNNYRKAGHPVGRFLADQLLLPVLCLNPGKGCFKTGQLSRHFKTNLLVLRAFSDSFDAVCDPIENGVYVHHESH